MEANLKFNLDNPEEYKDLARCMKSSDMANVIWEIQYNLRKQCEWELESLEADSDKWDGLEVVFRKLNELIHDNNIIIDELWS